MVTGIIFTDFDIAARLQEQTVVCGGIIGIPLASCRGLALTQTIILRGQIVSVDQNSNAQSWLRTGVGRAGCIAWYAVSAACAIKVVAGLPSKALTSYIIMCELVAIGKSLLWEGKGWTFEHVESTLCNLCTWQYWRHSSGVAVLLTAANKDCVHSPLTKQPTVSTCPLTIATQASKVKSKIFVDVCMMLECLPDCMSN